MAQASMSATASTNRRPANENSGVRESQQQPRDLASHLMEYAEENPTSCAMWCFGIGFVLGWRLKPW